MEKQKLESVENIFKQFDDYVEGNCHHFSPEPARCEYSDSVVLKYYGPNDYVFSYGPDRIFGRNAGTFFMPDAKSELLDYAYEVALALGSCWDGFVKFVDVIEQTREEKENALDERITLNKLVEMVKERDALAAKERACEMDIFDKDRVWSKKEMDVILKDYHNVKIDRAAFSEAVAREFMRCAPRERHIFANNWFQTDEGKRKLRDL